MAQAMETGARGRKNGAARDALRSRATDVLDDFSELRKDMGRLAHAASKAARVEVGTVGKRLEKAGRDLRARAAAGAHQAAEQVRAHPGAAIGLSLGAGLLIGMLLARR
ncbi:MAG: hypothetical protein AB7Q23_07040 [Hyphomonadaceae bacterium]